MQLFNDVGEKVAQLVRENSTTLLTASGVIGTVATAVLTGRASVKAYQILQAEEDKRVSESRIISNEEIAKITPVEKAMLVGIHFVPPILMGSLTIGSIIMANRMSAQKAAALAAAYGMSQKHLEEYKAKVSEKLTGPKKQQIDDELAQDRVTQTKGHEGIVVVEGEVLCFDEPTGRYFRSTMENIKQAVNSTNAEILHHDHASASYFYEELDLPATTWTDEVGWNTDQLLELKYSTVLDPNNRPCIAIDFKTLPKADYVPKHY